MSAVTPASDLAATSVIDPRMLAIILVAAVATYMTRVGGYLVVSRLKNLPPRVDAALNAVPAAVLTTLVAPAFYAGGIEVKLAMLAGLLAGLRLSSLPMLAIAWTVAMALRHFGPFAG